MSWPARVLVIAGSDSGAGAGIQADLKTVFALGGYATTAITAVTAQNTLGVAAVHPVPPEFVARQIRVILEDIGADAIKTGMLAGEATIRAVAAALEGCGAPLVLDPVMVAKGGRDLLDPAAIGALGELLIPRAALITPNAPEAERLTRGAVTDRDGMRRAAAALLQTGAQAVLIKGGHIPGAMVADLLAMPSGEHWFEAPRIHTRAGHGTGCTLASAIAVRLAQGAALIQAVEDARAVVRAGLAPGLSLGSGHQPLDHRAAWR